MVNITWDDEAEAPEAVVQENGTTLVSTPSQNIKWDEASKQDIMKPPLNQGNFFDRITKLATARKEEMSEAVTNYADGNSSLGSTLLQVVGKGGFGTAGDLVGEATATGLSAIVPDAIEDPIKQYAYELLGSAYNSKLGQAISNEWGKLDDDTQKNLESTGNIMAWVLPKVKAGKLGTSLKDYAGAIKKGRMSKALKLPETPANKLAEAKRRFRDPHGFQDVVREVSSIDKVSPNKSLKSNITAVGDEVGKLDADLFKQLRLKSVDIPDDLIDQKIDLELSNLIKNNQWIQADSTVASAFDNNISAMQKVLARFPQTPQGLLRARREFDKMLKDNVFKVPEGELIARDAVSKVLRRAVNDVVAEAAPYAPVKATLAKQSRLLSGLDNLAENFALEKPAFGELRSIYKRYPMATAGILAGTGVGASVVSSPAVLGAAGTGLAAVGAYKATPSIIRGTGSALNAVGRVTDLGQLSTNLDKLPLVRSALLYGNEEEEKEPIEQQPTQ